MNMGPGVVPGLDLTFRFDLGEGNDSLDASFQRHPAAAGTIQPCVSLAVAAGVGDDRVSLVIGSQDTAEPLFLEDVTVSIGGGEGNDTAVIAIVNTAVTGSLIQEMNTGDGDDIVSLSWKGCEILGPAVTRVALAEDHDVADITFSDNKYFAAVTTSVDAGGGDDIVAVLQSNPNEFLGPVNLRMALGDGDDEGSFFCDGNTSVAGSLTLVMNTGAGDDRAEALFTNPSNDKKDGPLGVRVNAGAGDDQVNVVIRDANSVDGPLTVAVDGGTGDDGIVADVDFTPRIRAGQLDPGNAPVSVLINLRGGAGTDSINSYTEGVWSGVARFVVRGDDGDDAVGFHWGVGEGSTGRLAVEIGGGAGDDVLTADSVIPVEQVTPIYLRLLGGIGDDVLTANFLGGPDTTPASQLYLLDGGLGFDFAHAPAGALVRNCEGRI